MKKSKIKAICALLCCSFLFSSSVATAVTQEEAINDLTAAERASMAQVPALLAYGDIYDIIIHTDDDGKIIDYHDEYGGCYINDDNALIVLVKSGCTNLIAELDEVLEDDSPIEFEYCEWTLEDAETELNKIASFLPKDKIERVYYTAKRNAFVFDVLAENADTVAFATQSATRNISAQTSPFDINIICETNEITSANSSSIPFSPYALTYIRGGSPIYCLNENNILVPNASVCITGYYTGYGRDMFGSQTSYFDNEACILTAGHSASDDCYLSTSTSSYAETIHIELEDGDYGMIKIPNGFARTNAVYISNGGATGGWGGYNSSASYPVEGTVVYKYGISTKLTEGIIRGVSYTSNSQGYGPELLVQVNSSSNATIATGGDSGGPVWLIDGNGNRILMGLTTSVSNTANTMYYTPIFEVVRLGFEPYLISGVDPFE